MIRLGQDEKSRAGAEIEVFGLFRKFECCL
jgi:hypothetical protein